MHFISRHEVAKAGFSCAAPSRAKYKPALRTVLCTRTTRCRLKMLLMQHLTAHSCATLNYGSDTQFYTRDARLNTRRDDLETIDRSGILWTLGSRFLADETAIAMAWRCCSLNLNVAAAGASRHRSEIKGTDLLCFKRSL